MAPDTTLMHLMCAKICHDLAAPASAVAMGLEMLEATPQDAATRDLITFSAQSTLAKLEVFRCLTGYSTMPTKPTGIDIQKALQNYWPDQKIKVDWQVPNLEALQGPSARLLLAALLIGADTLPRGGTLTIQPSFQIKGDGPTVSLKNEVAQALSQKSKISEQTAGTIIPFFAQMLAQHLGKTLVVREDEEQILIEVG